MEEARVKRRVEAADIAQYLFELHHHAHKLRALGKQKTIKQTLKNVFHRLVDAIRNLEKQIEIHSGDFTHTQSFHEIIGQIIHTDLADTFQESFDKLAENQVEYEQIPTIVLQMGVTVEFRQQLRKDIDEAINDFILILQRQKVTGKLLWQVIHEIANSRKEQDFNAIAFDENDPGQEINFFDNDDPFSIELTELEDLPTLISRFDLTTIEKDIKDLLKFSPDQLMVQPGWRRILTVCFEYMLRFSACREDNSINQDPLVLNLMCKLVQNADANQLGDMLVDLLRQLAIFYSKSCQACPSSSNFRFTDRDSGVKSLLQVFRFLHFLLLEIRKAWKIFPQDRLRNIFESCFKLLRNISVLPTNPELSVILPCHYLAIIDPSAEWFRLWLLTSPDRYLICLIAQETGLMHDIVERLKSKGTLRFAESYPCSSASQEVEQIIVQSSAESLSTYSYQELERHLYLQSINMLGELMHFPEGHDTLNIILGDGLLCVHSSCIANDYLSENRSVAKERHSDSSEQSACRKCHEQQLRSAPHSSQEAYNIEKLRSSYVQILIDSFRLNSQHRYTQIEDAIVKAIGLAGYSCCNDFDWIIKPLQAWSNDFSDMTTNCDFQFLCFGKVLEQLFVYQNKFPPSIINSLTTVVEIFVRYCGRPQVQARVEALDLRPSLSWLKTISVLLQSPSYQQMVAKYKLLPQLIELSKASSDAVVSQTMAAYGMCTLGMAELVHQGLAASSLDVLETSCRDKSLARVFRSLLLCFDKGTSAVIESSATQEKVHALSEQVYENYLMDMLNRPPGDLPSYFDKNENEIYRTLWDVTQILSGEFTGSQLFLSQNCSVFTKAGAQLIQMLTLWTDSTPAEGCFRTDNQELLGFRLLQSLLPVLKNRCIVTTISEFDLDCPQLAHSRATPDGNDQPTDITCVIDERALIQHRVFQQLYIAGGARECTFLPTLEALNAYKVPHPQDLDLHANGWEDNAQLAFFQLPESTGDIQLWKMADILSLEHITMASQELKQSHRAFGQLFYQLITKTPTHEMDAKKLMEFREIKNTQDDESDDANDVHDALTEIGSLYAGNLGYDQAKVIAGLDECDDLFHMDCFTMSIVIVCIDAVEVKAAVLADFFHQLQRHRNAVFLWPQYQLKLQSSCDLNPVAPAILLAHAVEVVLEQEFPSIQYALRRCSITPASLVLRWIRQCFWNYLEWPSILQYIWLTLSEGIHYQIYFILAVFKHIEPDLRKHAAHDRLVDTFFDRPIANFYIREYTGLLTDLTKYNDAITAYMDGYFSAQSSRVEFNGWEFPIGT